MRAFELFDEALSLAFAVRQWAETLHAELELTASMRGVLEHILLDGPSTVPNIARPRGVSRQHIQQQINMLLEDGFVELRDNPAHKRSSMVALTDKGRGLIQNMRANELNTLSRIQVGVSDNATREAAQVLSAWSSALQRDTERRASRL